LDTIDEQPDDNTTRIMSKHIGKTLELNSEEKASLSDDLKRTPNETFPTRCTVVVLA
jgi:hypothetical protein